MVVYFKSDSIFVLLVFTTDYWDWKVKTWEEKEEPGKTLERKRKRRNEKKSREGYAKKLR